MVAFKVPTTSSIDRAASKEAYTTSLVGKPSKEAIADMFECENSMVTAVRVSNGTVMVGSV